LRLAIGFASQRCSYIYRPARVPFVYSHTAEKEERKEKKEKTPRRFGNHELRAEWVVIIIIIGHRDGTSCPAAAAAAAAAEKESSGLVAWPGSPPLEIGETAQSVEQFGVKLPSTASAEQEEGVQASSSSGKQFSPAIAEQPDIHLVAAIKSRVTKAVVHQVQADWTTTPLPPFFPCCMAAGCSPVKANTQ
jgi:hypothetical protein